MANLIFLPIADQIKSGTYLLYDGACGTGGMLTVAEETLAATRRSSTASRSRPTSTARRSTPRPTPSARPTCCSRARARTPTTSSAAPEWSTLSHDAFPAQEFDFMLSNPPYGKSWKKDLERMGGKDGMRDPRFMIVHEGEEYRLVTRSSDGQMLFLANMVSKMKHNTPLGSRIAEVHNGSSLFTGDAGQGESNIRRWIIENDWLEAIVALPLNLFYNTGIATYIWVLTNRKPEHRKGKVQLIDATQWFKPLRKNLGKKNCELSDDDIERICETFLDFEETEQSKIFPNAAFGYWKVTVERPLARSTRHRPATRAYSRPKEIKALDRTTAAIAREDGAPRRSASIHKPGKASRPIRCAACSRRRRRQALRRRIRARHRPARHRAGAAAGRRRHRGLHPPRGAALHARRLDRRGKHQDRLRDQLHAPLLQAAAAAHAGGDPRRHPGLEKETEGCWTRSVGGDGTT